MPVERNPCPSLLASRSRAADVLRSVHAEPGITRTRLADTLGMSSGAAADVVRRLVEFDLVSEGPAIGTGARGRPTRALGAHPHGPLVVVAAVAHESWQVATVELGGAITALDEHRHTRRRAIVLHDIAAAVGDTCTRQAGRVRALAVSVPGAVSGATLVQAPNLGWTDVDLLTLRPPQANGVPLLAGNDATLSALAESRRGAATGTTSSVHLYMDSGIGGALIDNGRIVPGATGRAGEFGHLPFGRRDARCRCGAHGCWNTSLDGTALARALGQPAPPDEVSFSRELLAAARAGGAAQRRVADQAAATLGRGIAGLVNALDPEIVTVGGLASELLAIAQLRLERAYRRGLMSAIATRPPEILPGLLGELAPLRGAAELAFDSILDDMALVPPPAG